MATTNSRTLSSIHKSLSTATTPENTENTTTESTETTAAEFPTSLEDIASEAPNVETATQDKSVPTAGNNRLPGLVSLDENAVVTKDVQLGAIQQITPTVTSKSSTPMSISTQIDKVEPTIVSVEQMVYQLKGYIDNYLKLNTSNVVPFKSHVEAKACAEAFLSLVDYAVSCNHPHVYESIYTFFKEHKKGILQEIHALQGANYLKKEESMRLQIFYDMFNRITDVPRRGLNLELVRTIFIGEKGNTLINYVIMKTSV